MTEGPWSSLVLRVPQVMNPPPPRHLNAHHHHTTPMEGWGRGGEEQVVSLSSCPTNHRIYRYEDHKPTRRSIWRTDTFKCADTMSLIQNIFMCYRLLVLWEKLHLVHINMLNLMHGHWKLMSSCPGPSAGHWGPAVARHKYQACCQGNGGWADQEDPHQKGKQPSLWWGTGEKSVNTSSASLWLCFLLKGCVRFPFDRRSSWTSLRLHQTCLMNPSSSLWAIFSYSYHFFG